MSSVYGIRKSILGLPLQVNAGVDFDEPCLFELSLCSKHNGAGLFVFSLEVGPLFFALLVPENPTYVGN